MKLAKERREKRKLRIEAGADSSDSEPEEPTEKRVEPAIVNNEIQEPFVAVQTSEDSKPKVDIWKKRTVGHLYDDAVARYWQRKAARESKGA